MQVTGILQNIPAEQYESAGFDGVNVVQQFLNKAEGTEPVADPATKENAVEGENAADIVDCAAVSAEGALKRAQGAGADGTGAGIAVDSGDTEFFGISLINIAGEEALEVDIEQQRKI